MRAARASLAGLGLALLIAAATASAQPAPSPQASVTEGQVPPPQGSAVDTDQISPTTTKVTQSQLSAIMRTADAPNGPTTVGQGRNAAVAPIKGQDHCDAAVEGAAAKPECAAILDRQAASFTPPPPAPSSAAPVNTNTDATGLVDSIVNGGTGTVVTLPSPHA